MHKHIFSFIGFFFIFSFCRAQEWIIKSDKNGIKTYAKKVTDSKINAVKIETVYAATLAQFVSVLLDVGSYDSWIFNSKSTRLLKQVSPSELFYYSEVSFPWPAVNRDFVSHVMITQDPHTKVVCVNANNVEGYIPVKSNIVRISRSSGRWIITPIGKNEVKVAYVLQVDPGGDLPAWLINPFAAKGLVETFKNLRNQVKKSTYASAHPAFLTE